VGVTTKSNRAKKKTSKKSCDTWAGKKRKERLGVSKVFEGKTPWSDKNAIGVDMKLCLDGTWMASQAWKE